MLEFYNKNHRNRSAHTIIMCTNHDVVPLSSCCPPCPSKRTPLIFLLIKKNGKKRYPRPSTLYPRPRHETSTRPYTLYPRQKDRFFCLSRLTWDSMQIAVLLKCGSADRVAFYSLVWIHDNFSLVEHMQCLSRKFLRDQNSSLKKKLFFMFVFNSSPHRYQLNPSCLVVISWSLRIQVSTDT